MKAISRARSTKIRIKYGKKRLAKYLNMIKGLNKFAQRVSRTLEVPRICGKKYIMGNNVMELMNHV